MHASVLKIIKIKKNDEQNKNMIINKKNDYKPKKSDIHVCYIKIHACMHACVIIIKIKRVPLR